ncbi:MAG: tRNA (guanosine(46)-N7)-methyltransferase TrmB [Phycisphaerales bacterium]|nr:tRNA (guanosine(46)-N7)-methyltransferase TrmB [Phycisphaerales bacterium]
MLTLEEVIVSPPAAGEVLDLTALFGCAAPLEIEIGTGKGTFLLNRAKAMPERNFFGLEWANQYYLYAAARVVRWGLSNIRLMRTDARHLVIHQLPPESVRILHIYHPDPWPKKRHHKRRLFQPEFVAAAARILLPGGRLAIQTDHAEYFSWIRRVVAEYQGLVEIPFDCPESGVIAGRVATNFEVKYLREGRPIYQIALMKIGV